MAFLSFISREQEGSHVSSALFPSATPGNRSHCYQSGLFRRIIMSRRLLRLPHSECSIKSAPRRNITTPSWESGSPCTVAISLRTFKSRCRKYQVCVAPRSITSVLKEYQVVYLKEVSRNVVNTKASSAFVQRLIVASSLLSSMRVAHIALAAAKRGAGCALHVTLDFISRTPVTTISPLRNRPSRHIVRGHFM